MRHSFFPVFLTFVLLPAYTLGSIEDVVTTRERRHAISLGLSLHQFDYKEKVSVGKSTESGVLPTMHIGYRASLSNAWILGLQGAMTFAKTKYDGTTMDGKTAIQGDTSNEMYNFEVHAGRDFLDGSQYSLVPYLGLGYHHWARDLRGPDASRKGGYRENYRWWYLPVGMRVGYQSGGFSIALDASLRWNLGGSILANMGDVDSRLDDHRSSLGSALGYRLAMPIAVKVSDGFAIVGTPFYEQTKIGQGDGAELTSKGRSTGIVLAEPESTTHMYGMQLGAHFAL